MRFIHLAKKIDQPKMIFVNILRMKKVDECAATRYKRGMCRHHRDEEIENMEEQKLSHSATTQLYADIMSRLRPLVFVAIVVVIVVLKKKEKMMMVFCFFLLRESSSSSSGMIE